MNRERSPAKANAGGSSNSGGAATMTPGVAANRMLKRYRDQAERVLKNKQEQLDKMRSRKLSSDYLRQMPRRWEAGDVYSPHDLSPVEMQKWRTRSQRKADVVDVLGIRPLDMYKVSFFASLFPILYTNQWLTGIFYYRTFLLRKNSHPPLARLRTLLAPDCVPSTSARLQR